MASIQIRRQYSVSEDEKARMIARGMSKVEIYGFFPNDPPGCDCQELISDWMKKLHRSNQRQRSILLSEMPHLECPKVAEVKLKGWKRYRIRCKNCSEIMGWCWSPDASISTWVDFHYYQWHQGDEWHGAITPHISPIDGSLCFECSCGEDTRDFRLNRTLSFDKIMKIEQRNSKGRAFGKAASVYLAVQEQTQHGRGSIR